ncbi:hypothetical protein HID58_030097 [Brassica napus]|uniref:Uncharacterized protein n=1 Tax=Brassica napus TaxID=3708 RepID=A0ABQ8CH47_BRANA|nr:hypothetical protein HID58_030097 [Brassica napus]
MRANFNDKFDEYRKKWGGLDYGEGYRKGGCSEDELALLKGLRHSMEVNMFTVIGLSAAAILVACAIIALCKRGCGIMGSKSQAKTKAKERLLAKEAAQRMN